MEKYGFKPLKNKQLSFDFLDEQIDGSYCEKCNKEITHETTVWCVGLDKVKHQYCQECAKELEKERKE